MNHIKRLVMKQLGFESEAQLLDHLSKKYDVDARSLQEAELDTLIMQEFIDLNWHSIVAYTIAEEIKKFLKDFYNYLKKIFREVKEIEKGKESDR